MSYQAETLSDLLSKTRVFHVSGDVGVYGLDSREEESKSSPRVHASGAPSSTRFSATAQAGDNFGHFRETTSPIGQQSKTYSNITLQSLAPYKVRDLFASQAARVLLTRQDVVKRTQQELYVPRTAKLLRTEDFSEFNAAANAYAATMANTTANARAKAAARSASMAAAGTTGTAGSGGGAAATVAAATANALAASNPAGSSLHLPVIPDTIDAFELGKAAATEAYLQDIWNENRQREASDERLRKHIKKLVHEWSSKLARFEEEVQRRQEDTYYAKYRRQEAGNPLARSMNGIDALREEQSHSHQGASTSRARAAEEGALHHRREAFSVTTAGKTDHRDDWPLGTDLSLVDPKAGKVNKEAAKKRKQELDHIMAHSVCASTLAAPPQSGPLATILAAAQAQIAAAAPPSSIDAANDHTHLTFSPFRPTSTPAARNASAVDGDDSRPASQPSKLPHLPGMGAPPAGLSVRQTRAPRADGSFAQSPPPPHVFTSESVARAAGIARPEYAAVPPHARRHADLLDVDRVKHRLARAHIGVPRGTLERALVAPEVVFTSEQQAASLPQPFFGLTDNPFEGQKKKGKGGKGKKGSKKKGKGK